MQRREAKQIRALLLLSVLQKGFYFFLFLIISHQHGSLSLALTPCCYIHQLLAHQSFINMVMTCKSPYQKWSHTLQCLVIKPHDAPKLVVNLVNFIMVLTHEVHLF